ncbi:uncharacterized protein FMAN_07343 [Fusarium mangiferae]|uniref:Uncharacterized protein n=1 Tax=Fusarium mangiferae TaxID=192010 RepID=A0A1L7TB36_FUSMA|nr:uncharacterized protein FMAN_07343 [Fusarium mangiferae]CVK92447.1 uncharacterized protein FMAN_07343 [Fusarium mangiferae]
MALQSGRSLNPTFEACRLFGSSSITEDYSRGLFYYILSPVYEDILDAFPPPTADCISALRFSPRGTQFLGYSALIVYLLGTKAGSIYMHRQLRDTLETTHIYQHDIEKFLNCVKRQLGVQKDGILESKDLGGSITTAKAEVIFGGIEPETIIKTRLSGEINFEVVTKSVSMTGAGTLGLFRVKTVLGKDADLH